MGAMKYFAVQYLQKRNNTGAHRIVHSASCFLATVDVCNVGPKSSVNTSTQTQKFRPFKIKEKESHLFSVTERFNTSAKDVPVHFHVC